jgi:ribosome-binding factor A
MAQGRRVERVAASIRREVSELLVTGIKDDRVNLAMVSVTNVDVAGDLQHCKVHVSIFGSEDDRQQALEGLRSASNYVKGELSRRLNMRRTPEVIFLLDRGIEKGTTVLGLINKLGAERLEKGDVPAGSDVEPDVEPDAEEPGLDPDADPDAAGGAAARGPAPAGPLEGDDD